MIVPFVFKKDSIIMLITMSLTLLKQLKHDNCDKFRAMFSFIAQCIYYFIFYFCYQVIKLLQRYFKNFIAFNRVKLNVNFILLYILFYLNSYQFLTFVIINTEFNNINHTKKDTIVGC